jgi:hypothetical protein
MAISQISKKLKVFVIVIIVPALIVATTFVSRPISDSINKTDNETKFIVGNEATMKTIMQAEQLDAVNQSLHEFFGFSKTNYTLHDLFQWENQTLSPLNDTAVMAKSPAPEDILEKKVGKCGEYSILFTAACICTGHEARLAVVEKSDFSQGVHQFCEVKNNGTWTQIDSSIISHGLVVGNMSVYQGWGWWPLQEKGYSVFTFDANNAYNVTGDLT